MKMIRWSGRGSNQTQQNRKPICKGKFNVAPIGEKLSESRLRCYRHVICRDDEHIVR